MTYADLIAILAGWHITFLPLFVLYRQRQRSRKQLQKPDYARIALLEKELGIEQDKNSE